MFYFCSEMQEEQTSVRPRISGEEIQEIIDKRVEQLMQKELEDTAESNGSDRFSVVRKRKRKRLFMPKREKN